MLNGERLLVEGLQGDIFEAWRKGGYDVIVLFGHKGFNALSTVLEFDRPFQPMAGELHLPERPDPATRLTQSRLNLRRAAGSLAVLIMRNHGRLPAA